MAGLNWNVGMAQDEPRIENGMVEKGSGVFLGGCASGNDSRAPAQAGTNFSAAELMQ